MNGAQPVATAPPRVAGLPRSTVLGMVTAAGFLIVLATLPAWGGAGTMKLLVEFFTIVALAQMWNLLAGYAGLISIGQQAFVGLGAYALYIGVDRLRVHPLAALLLVAVVVGLLSIPTAALAFRLRGGYFAIGTWVIAEVFRIVVSNLPQVGAGTGVSVRSVTAIPLGDRQALTYWIALAVGAGSVIIAAAVMRSRLGLQLRAIRDGEAAARGLGVDVFRAKLTIYVIAAVGCAVAGGTIYLQLLRIQPSAAFSVEWTVVMIFVVIIGGIGRIEGPIAGAIVLFVLQETLADLGSLYLVLLGAVAIAVTLLAPGGLWGLITARVPIRLVPLERRLALEPSALPSSSAPAAGRGN